MLSAIFNSKHSMERKMEKLCWNYAVF